MRNLIMTLFTLSSVFSVKSQSLNLVGTWSVSVPSSSILEAGNDYNMILTSPLNQTLLDISVPVTTINWQVNVHKQDSFWDASLVLTVRKTGDGSGVPGSSIIPSGSTPYLQVGNLDQLFFQGSRNYVKIPIQYEIQGLSVLIPTGNYNMTVIYTLISY